ncbi:hypothetical protein [Nocardia cyriacigeorgica]|nr:hypothetical protein [Nocardia cyriacigeorgica]
MPEPIPVHIIEARSLLVSSRPDNSEATQAPAAPPARPPIAPADTMPRT